MKSNNNKRAKRVRRRSRPRKGNGSAMVRVPAGLHSLVHQACSNFDPFCQAAMGAKQYDNNTMPSLTYQNRQVLAVVTDASGQSIVWFNNTPTSYYAVGTITAGNVTAWTPTDSQFLTTVTSTNLAQWRVVSTGLRYYTTQAWTAASGYMVATEMSQTYAGFVGISASSLRLGPVARTLALRDAQVTVVGRSKGVKCREYQEVAGLDSGYTGTVLYFNGTASTTVGYIEFITNYEWTADPNSSFQFYASPAAEHKPAVLEAVTTMSSLNSNIKTFTGGVDSAVSFMSEAKTAVNKVAGLIEDVGAIGGMISPGARGITAGAHALRLLTN